MQIYHISMNSLWRRKSRMLFLLVGLVIAVSTVIILINLSQAMNSDIAQKLDEYGANIVIVPHSDELSLSYGGMALSGVSIGVDPLKEDDLNKIKHIKNWKNISTVAPKLLEPVTIDGKRVLVAGIKMDSELKLKKWWKIRGESPKQANEVLIGNEAARKLKIAIGQTVAIHGSDFTIRGIIEETGSQDDHIIFADLAQTQELFNKKNELSLVELSALCYDCPVEEIVRQISGQLPGTKVTAIRQTIQSKMETIQRFNDFSFGISLVILLVGGMMVFTTFSASINERKREIGVFRSIGFRKKDIMQIILLEALVISSLAGLVGFLAGLFFAKQAAPLIGADNVVISVEYMHLILAVALSVTLTALSSLYPAIRAANMDPMESLRSL